jgi:hypothetical protein
MEKKKLRSLLIWTALTIGLLALFVGVESYRQNGKIDYKEIAAIFLGSITLFAIFINYFLSKNSNKELTSIKSDVNILKESDKHIKNDIKALSLDQKTMQIALKDIDEGMKHKQDIIKLCQQIENETYEKFDNIADINYILRDYIVTVNGKITDIIEHQYSYDFELFNVKFFKSRIISEIKRLNNDIDYTAISEHCFEKISDKVIHNIREYIRDLNYIKELENGKRRKRFKELTLDLTNQIASHSIDIYKDFKQMA